MLENTNLMRNNGPKLIFGKHETTRSGHPLETVLRTTPKPHLTKVRLHTVYKDQNRRLKKLLSHSRGDEYASYNKA